MERVCSDHFVQINGKQVVYTLTLSSFTSQNTIKHTMKSSALGTFRIQQRHAAHCGVTDLSGLVISEIYIVNNFLATF